MKQALYIPAEGPSRIVSIDEGNELAQLQKLVGGYIEAVTLKSGHTLWLNEEGKLNGLPRNRGAQYFFDLHFGIGQDILVGDAVLMGGANAEGETLGLTDDQVEAYSAFLVMA